MAKKSVTTIIYVGLFVIFSAVMTEAVNVVWSINAGGEKHVDIHGIR